MKKVKFLTVAIAATALFGSCTKMDKVNNLNTGSFTDTTGGPLKSAASFPVGFAIDNNLFLNNIAYKATVVKEASSVTFGNEMKYGSIVQNDGTFNFA
ncbi:MAG TPA: endo-1,4-beta-xylanase, partial [Chitinophagaceae bacterium]|nr:endo-1,4-beta-xylanase [Chitinophagaceae bacterium]